MVCCRYLRLCCVLSQLSSQSGIDYPLPDAYRFLLLPSRVHCIPISQSVVGGYGFDGGYGGYNFGAPSYAPPVGSWPGQAQAAPVQNYGGAYGQPTSTFGGMPSQQMGGGYGYRPSAPMNIPAGALYNGRPINRSLSCKMCFDSLTNRRETGQALTLFPMCSKQLKCVVCLQK